MKLWGGRFSQDQDAQAAELNNSISFDWRLGEVDVRASVAWAHALGQAGVLTPSEVSAINQGLQQVRGELAAGEFRFLPGDEDIHTAVERRLGELIGMPAGKLHTGRSRNDQVATDFRLWVLQAIDQVEGWLKLVQSALVNRAEIDWGIILPGYTHLQRAQPILLSHWWLSYFWPLQRDRQRLAGVRLRTATLPLGAGALAGTPFPVDRRALADALDFIEPAPNSIDAVSDRDFAAEFLFCAAMIGVHLSRMAESLVLFSTAEFGFIELAEAYTTGSSLMPQKKNPDPLELTRGKSGALIGVLTGLLATLKATPSTYDKDLQEDKPPVFAAFDALMQILPVVSGVIRTLGVHPERMQAALDPALLATDLADYLVQRGVPFRSAHHAVGMIVRRAHELDVALDQLPFEELASINPEFGLDVVKVFDYQVSIERRNVLGGTAPQAVLSQLEQAKQLI